MIIRGHPTIHTDARFSYEIPADATLAQRTLVVTVPSNQYKLQIIPKLPPLEQQQRQYRLFVVVNGSSLGRSAPIPLPGDTVPLNPNSLVFDASLLPGLNYIELHIIAALPKGQTLSNGADCELEKLILVTHLLR